MPRGRKYKAPEQSFLGNHSIDDLAKAATPEEFKEEEKVVEEPTIGDLRVSSPPYFPTDPDPVPNARILVSDVPFAGQTPDPSDTFIPLGEAANRVVAGAEAQAAAVREAPPPVAL